MLHCVVSACSFESYVTVSAKFMLAMFEKIHASLSGSSTMDTGTVEKLALALIRLDFLALLPLLEVQSTGPRAVQAVN